MVSVSDLFSQAYIKPLAYTQVFCTFLLSYFALFSSPDLFLLLLVGFACVGNYGWIGFVEKGFGSGNAEMMFRVTFAVSVVGFVGGIWRRVKYPELVIYDSDSDDEEDEEDSSSEQNELGSTRIKQIDVKKKDKLITSINRRGAKQKNGLKNIEGAIKLEMEIGDRIHGKRVEDGEGKKDL